MMRRNPLKAAGIAGGARKKRLGQARHWLIGVVFAVVGLPLGVISYVSQRDGIPWLEVAGSLVGGDETVKVDLPSEALPPGEKIDFLFPHPIGQPFESLPKISNIKVVDLDQDSLLDVIVCDCEANLVSWIKQGPQGVFTEKVLATNVAAPAHVDATDIDDDGDLDLLVAVLGVLFPSDDKIGSLLIIENQGDAGFASHFVLENVSRVSDVRAGDLDGDGDKDLAVAHFGYDYGETRWLENRGNWQFESHIIQKLSGGIHCEIADVNQDSFLDLILLVSQEWEEIYVFAGDGKGHFTEHLVFGTGDPDFGSSGIKVHDLDRDGDLDVLYTNGDAFDYLPPHPWPWHGVQWLENLGDLAFQPHRIADFGGAVGAVPHDIDGDGDLDLYAISTFNAWEKPASQSMIWLENNGKMRFRRRDITNTPTHIQALDLGDMDGDGDVDVVTGGMHVSTPFDRVERIVLWENRWPAE